MSDIKQKAREMFDKKFPEEFFMHDNCECWNETGEPTCYQYEQIKIREFLDQITDLAIAEERKRLIRDVEIFYVKKFNESKLYGTSNITLNDFINLITNQDNKE